MNNDPNLINQTEPEMNSNSLDNTNPQLVSLENTNPEIIPTESINPIEVTPQITPMDDVEILGNTEVLEPVTEPSTDPINIRYNAVTGEEMNLDEVKKGNDGKIQKAEANYKPPSTFSTIILILFFIGMLAFILYLPDIVVMVEDYNNKRNGIGEDVKEEIPTGKLVCTLDTNTVNLDRTIERVFQYTDHKLTSARFSTIVRGDATLDEEALEQLYQQCEQIKENVDGLSGVTVSCEYQDGKLIEKEHFDYNSYEADKVSNAYLEAGGSLLEFENGEEIDKVMVRMRQSGFSCDKEK